MFLCSTWLNLTPQVLQKKTFRQSFKRKIDKVISTNENIKRKQMRTKSKVINFTGQKRGKTTMIKSHAITLSNLIWLVEKVGLVSLATNLVQLWTADHHFEVEVVNIQFKVAIANLKSRSPVPKNVSIAKL